MYTGCMTPYPNDKEPLTTALLESMNYAVETGDATRARSLFMRQHGEGVESIRQKLLAHIVFFEGEKMDYAMADFQLCWIEDFAHCLAGKQIWRNCVSLKETGKTTLHIGMIKFALALRYKKFARFIHSDREVVVSAITGLSNHFRDPITRMIFGDMIPERGKEHKKARDTQTYVTLTNGCVFNGSTGLQSATGVVALGDREANRADLLIVDDANNIHTALSEVRTLKQGKYINEMLRGTDQATASVFSFSNPSGESLIQGDLDNDPRFVQQRLFLYDSNGALLWRCKPPYYGKYVEKDSDVTDFMAKYPSLKPPVSVETLSRDPDYRKVYLGERASPHELFFPVTEVGIDPIRIWNSGGAEWKVYEEYDGKSEYHMGTDSAEGTWCRG